MTNPCPEFIHKLFFISFHSGYGFCAVAAAWRGGWVDLWRSTRVECDKEREGRKCDFMPKLSYQTGVRMQERKKEEHSKGHSHNSKITLKSN